MSGMRQVILDTETTGLHPDEGHRIIEIGCVEIINRRLTGNRFHCYLNPERASDPDALKVHGLDDDFLRDQPLFASVAAQLLDFVRDAQIIIHNAPFDVGFLDAELKRVELPAFAEHVDEVIDSLAMAKSQFPGKRNSLDALCQRFAIDNSHRTLHGALLDAELLADVYLALTRGQDSLVIDLAAASTVAGAVAVSGSSALAAVSRMLPVVLASNDELAEHARTLAAIAKDSGGKRVWPEVEPA
jgi:DNA polymerase III subunit epsilon